MLVAPMALLQPFLEAAWLLVFFFPFVGLGVLIGHWRLVLALLGAHAWIALYLLVNDGWSGEGWGEAGVEVSLAIAVVSLLGAVAGVGASKLGERLGERRG